VAGFFYRSSKRRAARKLIVAKCFSRNKQPQWTISNNQISEDPTSADDNECNNEEELYDEIISFDETSKTPIPTIVTPSTGMRPNQQMSRETRRNTRKLH